MMRFLRSLWWCWCGRCARCGGGLVAVYPLALYSPQACGRCGWLRPEDDDEH